jgi:hypothetical protein
MLSEKQQAMVALFESHAGAESARKVLNPKLPARTAY